MTIPVRTLGVRAVSPLDQFPEIGRRREQLLKDVFPTSCDLEFYAIITQVCVHEHERAEVIEDFDTLFRLSGEPTGRNLDRTRAHLKVTEGSKRIKPAVATELLNSMSPSRHVLIRCWEDPNSYVWQVPGEAFFRARDMLKVLPHPFGEFEVTDEGGAWFMRIVDDDPLIFLQAHSKLGRRLIDLAPSEVLHVQPSIRYRW